MKKLLKELIVSLIFDFLFVFVHMKLIGWCLNTHWTVRTIAGVWILLEMIEHFVKANLFFRSVFSHFCFKVGQKKGGSGK